MDRDVIAQMTLVAVGRSDLHRRLGVFGAGLAVVIIVVNTTAAIEADRRGFSPAPQTVTPIMFMAVPLIDVLVTSPIGRFEEDGMIAGIREVLHTVA